MIQDNSGSYLLPEAEQEFKALLEDWYEAHGVSREHKLYSFWVEATGEKTYLAGERIARELSTLTSLENKTMLDVGCGFGGALTALSKQNVRCVGVDINRDELQLCLRRLSLHNDQSAVFCGDAYHLPFRDDEFDIVSCTEMLEHVRNRDELIAEMSRVLKPGGLMYLSFPNLLSIQNILSDPHYQLFGVVLLPLSIARWYTKKIRKRNYDVEILPLAPVISRMCLRNNVAVYSVNTSEYVLRTKLDSPNTISGGVGKILSVALKVPGIKNLIKAAISVKASVGASSVLAGFKA